LFKVIGGNYGEFPDFDNNTTSRAKLDVARIKIATDFRGGIDEFLKIKALGVVYRLRIVEEKEVVQEIFHGERFEEQEPSWAESVKMPIAVVEEEGDGKGGSTDKGEEKDDVDFLFDQHQERGVSKQVDGDGSLVLGGKGQNPIRVSEGCLEDQNGNMAQEESEKGSFVEEEGTLVGAHEYMLTKGGYEEGG
jgi:hypothetical protein